MSVLIRGMELPIDCHNCPLGFGGGCYFGTSADEYMCPDHGRADWCPLIPVPEHGRLIDAEALVMQAPIVGKLMMFGGEYVYTQSEIDRAPTIIPAEGATE